MENELKKYRLAGFRVLEYNALESTNTTAAALPREELRDKTVVLTYRQAAGRGQGSNTWESEPGKNISVSIVFCPRACEASRQFAVSMVIALGCRDFIRKFTEDCTVKWPNDIYVGECKIAGILIEHCISGNRIASSVCGIGLNVNQKQFCSDAPNPVSLLQLTGKELNIQQALEMLLACIDKWYGRIEDYACLEKEYRESMYRREGVYKWEDERGRFRASIAGVDEYGRLVLKDITGKDRVYGFKEVKFC